MPSNRTNVELKWRLPIIIPNYTTSSNRTNVELKYVVLYFYFAHPALLIAPMWN